MCLTFLSVLPFLKKLYLLYLCEGEEKTQAAGCVEGVVDFLVYDAFAGGTSHSWRVSGFAGVDHLTFFSHTFRSGVGESAATQQTFSVQPGIIRSVAPSLQFSSKITVKKYRQKKPLNCYYRFNNLHFLVLVESQGCTGHGELDDKDAEQDDHVEEQHDLMVLQGSDQPEDGHKQEKHSTGHDSTQNGQTGDDSGRFAISSDSNQQEGHQLQV